MSLFSDLLQVPLEETRDKVRIAEINSHSDVVWARIFKSERRACSLPVLMNN